MKAMLIDCILPTNEYEGSFVFNLTGVPRYVLQELARHRVASYSVKSSRYTLVKEFRDEDYFINNSHDVKLAINRATKYIELSKNEKLHFHQLMQLDQLLVAVKEYKIKSDEAKLLLPESWLCDIVWTIDGKSLDNFLTLRSSPQAHEGIRELANLVTEELRANS